MKMSVTLQSDIDIPADVVTCPRCDSPLYIDVHEWETHSGRPTHAGYYVKCKNDWRRFEEWQELCQRENWSRHRPFSWNCEWTYDEGLSAEADIDEWLEKQFPDLCEQCREPMTEEDVEDSGKVGTVMRCRACLLKFDKNLVSALC